MEKMKKTYVPIFYDWAEVTEELTAEEKGRMIDAIVLYARGKGDSIHLTGNEKYLFPAFRKQIDQENEKSENKSQAAAEREREKAQKAQGTTKSTKGHKTANNNKNKNDNKKENDNKNDNKNDNEETVSRDTGKNDDLFARFWSLYPRKQDKAKAREAFGKIAPDEQLLATMLAAIETQKQSPQWTRDGGQYIPLATTWLHGQRWEDEGIDDTGLGHERDYGRQKKGFGPNDCMDYAQYFDPPLSC